MAKNILEMKKAADQVKYSGSVVMRKDTRENFDSSRYSYKDADAKELVQKKREESAQPKDTSVPSASKIRADAARKRLDRYMKSDERKSWAKKQQDDLYAQSLLTGITDGQWQPETDHREQELRDMADYWQSQVDAEHNRDVTARNLETIGAMTAEDRAAFEKYISGGTYVEDRDIEAHKGLKSRYGDQLERLKETWVRQQDVERNRQAAEKTAAMLDSNMDRALAWIPSAAAQIIGGVTGSAARINEMFNGTGQYKGFAETTRGDWLSTIGKTVQEETGKAILGGEELNLLDGISGREVGALAYQGATSLLNIAGRIALSFGSAGIGAGLAATQTFADSMSEASKQGASAEQAVILSVGKAGLEAATEKLPLDDLLDIARQGGKGFWTVLKQAVTEITEEELSLFGGIAMEAAVLREKSSYKQNIGDMVAAGVPYEKAKEQADRAVWNEALQTAVVSGFSGAASAKAANYYNSVTGSSQSSSAEAQPPATKAQPPSIQAERTEIMTPETQPEATAQAVPAAPEAAQPDQDQIGALLEGIRQEQEERKLVENIDWMRQTFEENAKKAEVPDDHTADDSGSSVRSQIRENQDSLNAMEPVASIQTPPRFSDMPKSDRKAWVINKLRSTNYKVDRKGFGVIKFAEKQLKSAFNYLKKGSVEEASFEALPYVLEHGTQISTHPVHKGREYGTVTFAAPVVINGKRGNMAVVVKQTTENFYKVHRILTPDGSVFDLSETTNEAGSSLAGESPETGSLATPINPASTDSVPQITEEVNGNIDESSTQDADIQEQSPEGGQIKGTGAAERNFSGVAAYEDMLYDGNIQKERPDAVRDVEMPKLDSDGRRVTEFAGNAVSAGVTPDSMADAIKSLVGDKQLSFDTRTNKQSLENAAKAIKENGDTAVISALHTNAENKTIVDGDIEKGLVLYAQYANNQDPKSQETAAQLIVDMAAIANMSGRNLQLFSLMKRMTPEGQLMTVRKNVGRYIDGINKTRSGRKQIVFAPGTENLNAAKAVANKQNVTIDEALEQNFINAKTEEQKKAALDDIYKNVAVQIKPTLGEVWDAWRNLAMLGNIKTHERNAGSTAAFQPYAMVKRNIGAVLEKVFLKQEARTKSVITGPDGEAILRWAEQDAKKEDIKKLLGGSSTAGDDARNAIQDNRKILPGLLDTARKKNMDLMEAEDSFFKRREYARSLASFLKARGYAANQLQNNQVPKGVLDEARQYAVKEAQKATFNDQNKLSDSISKLNNLGERFGGSAYHIISKGAVPFLRTPLNVVKRAAEYNPISMANTLFHAKGDINSGRKSASDVIDEVSAGLTGTAAMALGAALAAGLVPGVELVGAIDDEDELREGAQEYSIRIGDEYYGAAWLAPAMIPLFIGANLYKQFSSLDEGADGWDMVQALVDVGTDALDPMLELSMLSSLSDIIEKVKYEDSAADMAVAAFLNAVTSYFTQGIPTVFGQIEQTTETEKSTTYVNTDNKTERMVKTAVSGATKRLPGDLYQTTKLDEWGEPVKNEGDWMERAFNAVLNPFSVSTRKTDDITKELSRLNDAQTEDVTPPTAAKTLSYTDKQGNVHKDIRLTEEQYQTLAQTQGQTAKRILKDMIGSKDYAALTDEQKAKAIQQAYSYARETAEIAAIGDDHTGYEDAWMMELTEDSEARYILRRVASGELSGAMDALNTAWDKGYDDTGRSNELQWAYDTFKNLSLSARNEVKEWATGTTAKYIEAREKGVSHRAFVNAAENISKVKGTGSNGSIRDIDRREAIATTRGLSEKNIDAIMKCYMEDYDPENGKTATTELKYDYIRQELGLSPKQYAQTYRAHLDNSKKADKIAAMMELGYDKKTATALYNVYAGNSKGKAAYMSLYED